MLKLSNKCIRRRISSIRMDLSESRLILPPILSSQHLLTITFSLIRKICSKILHIFLIADCFALECIRGIYTTLEWAKTGFSL